MKELGVKACNIFKSSFGLELLALIIYFILGIIFYTQVEDWPAGDAIYFAFVVMTTVGYGDLLPTSDGSKVFTCFYVLFALAIAGVALASVMNALVIWALKAKSSKTGIFDEAGQRRKRQKRFLGALLTFLVTIVFGTIIYAVGMDFEEHGMDGDKWVNGLYLTIITVTTVGFGDLSPVHYAGYKFFTIVLMVIGIPVFAFSLATFTEVIFGEQRDKVELNLVEGGLCKDKFKGLEDFCEKIAEMGAANKGSFKDGEIDRFEFLSFLLVQNGVVDMETIKEAIDNFDTLDRTKSNCLTRADVDHWMATHTRSHGSSASNRVQVKSSAVYPTTE